jgi:hypothetical protein
MILHEWSDFTCEMLKNAIERKALFEGFQKSRQNACIFNLIVLNLKMNCSKKRFLPKR